MNFGRDLRRFAACCFIAAASISPACAERDVVSADWSLPALMARLAETRAGTASFTERRVLQLVSTPLLSSGTLSYIAPDRLEKRTLLPVTGRLVLAGDRVTIERQGEATQTISLQDYPEIGALVAGLRATMAGDLATLQRYYRVSLEGNAGAWSLRLQPLAERARKLVREIRIDGSGATLTRIDTEDADGDRTETTIVPAPP
jgi:outer membrane lipoprotein-sorting protein